MVTENPVNLRKLSEQILSITLGKTACQQHLFIRIGLAKGKHRFDSLLFRRLYKAAGVYNNKVRLLSILHISPALLFQIVVDYLGINLVFRTAEAFNIEFILV